MDCRPSQTNYAAWRNRLASGLCPQLYTVEWLDRRLAEGSAFFFANERCALVVELKQYPTGAVVVKAVVAAGDVDGIIEELGPAVTEWGRANGASFEMIQSRDGWARKMREHGFQEFQRILIREI